MLRSLARALLVLALCLSAGVPARLPAQTPLVSGDTVERVVSLRLDVTAPAGAPSALISGYRDGGVQVVVPRGWTVAWRWESHDSTAPHSLVLMAEREKLPGEGGQPAIEDALTRSVTRGLAAGVPDLARFEADEVGWYWLLCGVPGHALRGEWIGLRIHPDASAPSLQEKAR